MKKDKKTDKMELIAKAGCICFDCAESNGATWPEGHCATIAHDIQCGVCKEMKSCSAVNDWNWPDKKLSRNREV